MFERAHHRRIEQVLLALDGPRLSSLGCLFGGGTAIVLKHGEYRESADIDFVVSHAPGYRELRQALTRNAGGAASAGLAPIVRAGRTLALLREVRADQYGVRTLLGVDGTPIKLEIVFEARITLAAPAADDAIAGVPCLTALDMAATKLLALSDRWADRAVHSRDLIDLAMLQCPNARLRQAIAKAEAAYGDSVRRDLGAAIAQLRAQPGRLAECMAALGMTGVPRAVLWGRIRRLHAMAASA